MQIYVCFIRFISRMKLVLVVLLVLFPFLHQTLAVWLQSALYRHQISFVSYGNFTRDPNNRLRASQITIVLVQDQFDCTFQCIGELNCYSFNLAAHPNSGGLYLCELLATDKYRANELHANSAFHHYSPWSSCQQAPCQNNGTCIPDLKLNSYRCICQPGFAGHSCERRGTSCSEIKYRSSQATSGSYVIDPDSEGGYEPFTVFCDMADKNGVGVTVIGHDSEARTHVVGYEGKGSYIRSVNYLGDGISSAAQIAEITNVSTYCEQFIKYECYHATIFRYGYSWWVSRDHSKMVYWGGASAADLLKCACGVTSPNTCASISYGCNCDKNDGTWREDSGVLTDKSHLPVAQLRFGDTGHSGEEGYHTLGKFKCYGMI